MHYRIAKRFSFSASHQLTHLPPGHPCANLHGHNYEVTIELAAYQLDSRGFVVDYREVDEAVGRYIQTTFDHKHLNDVLGSSEGTTAENLAALIFRFAEGVCPAVEAVRVSETPKTWAEFRRGVNP